MFVKLYCIRKFLLLSCVYIFCNESRHFHYFEINLQIMEKSCCERKVEDLHLQGNSWKSRFWKLQYNFSTIYFFVHYHIDINNNAKKYFKTRPVKRQLTKWAVTKKGAGRGNRFFFFIFDKCYGPFLGGRIFIAFFVTTWGNRVIRAICRSYMGLTLSLRRERLWIFSPVVPLRSLSLSPTSKII